MGVIKGIPRRGFRVVTRGEKPVCVQRDVFQRDDVSGERRQQPKRDPDTQCSSHTADPLIRGSVYQNPWPPASGLPIPNSGCSHPGSGWVLRRRYTATGVLNPDRSRFDRSGIRVIIYHYVSACENSVFLGVSAGRIPEGRRFKRRVEDLSACIGRSSKTRVQP